MKMKFGKYKGTFTDLLYHTSRKQHPANRGHQLHVIVNSGQMTGVTRKQTLRSLSLSYQKKDRPSFFWYDTHYSEFDSTDIIDYILEKSVSCEKKDGCGHSLSSFFWYDNDKNKDLKVCFLVTRVRYPATYCPESIKLQLFVESSDAVIPVICSDRVREIWKCCFSRPHLNTIKCNFLLITCYSNELVITFKSIFNLPITYCRVPSREGLQAKVV